MYLDCYTTCQCNKKCCMYNPECSGPRRVEGSKHSWLNRCTQDPVSNWQTCFYAATNALYRSCILSSIHGSVVPACSGMWPFFSAARAVIPRSGPQTLYGKWHLGAGSVPIQGPQWDPSWHKGNGSSQMHLAIRWNEWIHSAQLIVRK